VRWLVLTLAAVTACDDPIPDPVETPERQFVFEGMQIEERRGERVLWTGTGARADGDMSSAWVENVELEYAGEPAKAGDVVVQSPRALLQFDDGVATFEEVVITDQAGGTLHAGRARYEEEHSHILADGPVEFSARGMTAHATRGVVLLDEGQVDIEGPVQGVYIRPQQ
jgi:hypothetical protein